MRCIPGKNLLIALAASVAIALIAAIADALPTAVAVACTTIVALFAAVDYFETRRRWGAGAPRMQRRLPAALALGATRIVHVEIHIAGDCTWNAVFFDHADATVATTSLPAKLRLQGEKTSELTYGIKPTRRGNAVFAPADLRITSRFGFWTVLDRVGETETRRVYPDFAQVARYAWLAGDRRLQEIGIKTFQQRGEGTDFKQLAEYQFGDAVRHIDWKATLRSKKPIVRQFQNERDQCVLLLIDCGRRMRADDRDRGIGTSHFDQVLNATMLLTYVALKQGDAVGALTFGTPPGEARWFAPRKGAATLNALMGELFSVYPSPTHSDYLAAAHDVLRRQRKRALVIVITNFRDEDSIELRQALQLLRTRHLVLTASLRETIVRELISQPLHADDAPLEIASAHSYEQSRRDAFNRLAAKDTLIVDAEPAKLGIELVNRYQAVKRAGMI